MHHEEVSVLCLRDTKTYVCILSHVTTTFSNMVVKFVYYYYVCVCMYVINSICTLFVYVHRTRTEKYRIVLRRHSGSQDGGKFVIKGKLYKTSGTNNLFIYYTYACDINPVAPRFTRLRWGILDYDRVKQYTILATPKSTSVTCSSI